MNVLSSRSVLGSPCWREAFTEKVVDAFVLVVLGAACGGFTSFLSPLTATPVNAEETLGGVPGSLLITFQLWRKESPG